MRNLTPHIFALLSSCAILNSSLSQGIDTPLRRCNPIRQYENIDELEKVICPLLNIPMVSEVVPEKNNDADSCILREEDSVRLISSPPPYITEDSYDQDDEKKTVYEMVPYENKSSVSKENSSFKKLKIPSSCLTCQPFCYQRNLKLKDSIVLFDCDNVLQRNVDAILQDGYIWDFLKNTPKERWKTAIWGGRKALVEKGMVAFVKHLQKNEVPVFVFTKCSSDDKTIAKRFKILQALGFDFRTDMFRNERQQELDLPEGLSLEAKPGQSVITTPKYYNGIFFMGSADKGTGLKATLNFIYKNAPRMFVSKNDLKIILVDDEEKNLKDFVKACQEYGVNGYPYQYTAAKILSSKNIPQRPIVQIQSQGLSQGIWLADRQAISAFIAITDPLLAAYSLIK